MSSNTNSPTKVPEFVYANNGAKYHPCLYCCRAFAHKRYLTLHMKACIRTHLNENDHKPSVSLFPATPRRRRDLPTTSGFDINDIALSDEVTIEKRTKPLQINTMRADIDGNECDEPPSKISKKSDENANMPTNSIRKKDSRKFSMENACKLCDEIFSSLDELIMHAKIEHNQRSKDNKKFSPEDIEYFLKVFTRMNKSHCPICRKAILNTLNWRGHLYTHCAIRKFVCKICGQCFTRQDHRKYHEMRHKHGSQKEEEEDEEVEGDEEHKQVVEEGIEEGEEDKQESEEGEEDEQEEEEDDDDDEDEDDDDDGDEEEGEVNEEEKNEKAHEVNEEEKNEKALEEK